MPAFTLHAFWHWFTRLGEAQILLPLALAAILWLALAAGEHVLARRWLGWLGFAVALTTATKLAFIGWGVGVAALNFTGISGHSMFAAAVLPVLAWVVLRGHAPRSQTLGVLMAYGAAALIAYSRVEVSAHSFSEALLGFVLGAWASGMVLRRAPALNRRPPLWLPVSVALALAISPGGAPPSRSHDAVTRLALKLSGHARAFTRADLLARPVPADWAD
ncbi:phosphatase PAP2 family protein [Roseateles koreensis]|uniref:Phosphatase PAP2 family protein n=1 Tax=Roseateles koreensis TaxID=2987526 RepID=A0ABT5KUF0_9BURK|nr:phosphatase PAP2 family protein [Roseateles koreensis]MDC8786566.1 phosphatase PAP2 family protein [Roseateles koreensis]